MRTHLGYLTVIAIIGVLLGVLYVERGQRTDVINDLKAAMQHEQKAVYRLTAVNDSLETAQRQVDTIYIAQKVTFRRADSSYQRAGTITVHDTVYVEKVKADADIKACSLVVLTCEQRAAVAEARAANRDSAATLAADMARKAQAIADGVTVQARKQKWQWGIVGFGAGSLTCNLLPLLHGR